MAGRALLLGFYDRGNLGDELYKAAFRALLGVQLDVDIWSMDDARDIVDLALYDAVVCGGGDIVNPYFMESLRTMYTRAASHPPCYAVSVGLPYGEDAQKYLPMFDHVFVRSRACLALALASGALTCNVSYLPDLVFSYGARVRLPLPTGIPLRRKGLKVVLCLAQPVFVGPSRVQLLSSLLALLADLGRRLDCTYYLAPFNTGRNASENDVALYDDLVDLSARSTTTMDLYHRLRPVSPDTMRDIETARALVGAADGVICMRYHSVVLALLERVPFFSVYTTRKVGNLLRDVDVRGLDLCLCVDEQENDSSDASCCQCSYELRTDALGLPVASAFQADVNCLAKRMHAFFVNQRGCAVINVPQVTDKDRAMVLDTIASRKRRVTVGPVSSSYPSPDEARRMLLAMLDRLSAGANLAGVGRETLARAVCYAASRELTSPCFWGLHEKLVSGAVTATESGLLPELYTIVGERKKARDGATEAAKLDNLAQLARAGLPSPLRLHVDMEWTSTDDFGGIHRSGWAYALSGLRFLKSPSSHSAPIPNIVLDTYVDRTFHWGSQVLRLADKIPYRVPWAGFVHHTFDTTHSSYNCERLFENETFLASLRTCVCLFALSEVLAGQLVARLTRRGFPGVPVRVVRHPTEIPPETRRFQMSLFLSEYPRRIVQIGAWLRQPYAIYELDVMSNSYGRLPPPESLLPSPPAQSFAKYVLRGKGMSQYFPPCDDFIRRMCTSFDPTTTSDQRPEMCRPEMCRPETCRPETCRPEMCRPEMCRPETSLTFADAAPDACYTRNKFITGICDMLARQFGAVTILDTLTDDAYDDLLASSVVFLNLVDASAVNTIIECMARNTPLVVNRLPAVEELLGRDYPGFYGSFAEASMLATSFPHIRRMHAHLKGLDKGSLDLATFVRGVHDALADIFCKPHHNGS